MTIDQIRDRFSKAINRSVEKEQDVNTVDVVINKTNVVSGETLRAVQAKTLGQTKEFLSKTFGPMGSNTKIIKGQNNQDISSSYSKDGLKVLSNIINSGPIESSIVEELIEITKHVEHDVGDGTTSTVVLSALIFDRLREAKIVDSIPPYELMRKFNTVVKDLKDLILSDKKDISIDDIYDISMISTNGNSDIANDIKTIYDKYGFDVELNVGISNTEDNLIKVYDGLTLNEGFSDPVFINNRKDNTAEIHNAKIYYFKDPIDDMSMITLFEAIIKSNIYDKIENDETIVPTVICCPRLSGDLSAILRELSNQLYQFDNQDASSSKPPIVVITNLVASDEVIMSDIANLCGCKTIAKYIDKKLYEHDVEAGIAPTTNNISEFAGDAELVVADSKKTKFINPKHMSIDNEKKDPIYTSMVNFLETEIEQASKSENSNVIGLLKRRLSSLKANMVDYLVGGITISDRDTTKDLAEDAIKNCKSASKYGVGYAANFEGLKHSYNLINSEKFKNEYDDVMKTLAMLIFDSYYEISSILYETVMNKEEADKSVKHSLEEGHPINISGSFTVKEGRVLCSIMLDINILETLSKIITKMVTCNQCLLQASHLNVYEKL